MTPTIRNHQGGQDGIRWGDVTVAQRVHRRFTHDLLTGNVRLYVHSGSEGGLFSEDTDPTHVAAVRQALGVVS